MLHTPLWTLLCALPRGRAALAPHERRLLTARLRAGALQPVNALVFVYDGLIYAVRAFGFLRNALLLGVCCTFAPALALAKTLSPSSLLAIWAAKAALNCWRCGSALLLIHVRHWPHWGGGRAQADPAPRVPAPHTRTRPPPSHPTLLLHHTASQASGSHATGTGPLLAPQQPQQPQEERRSYGDLFREASGESEPQGREAGGQGGGAGGE